jgi:DNA-binding NarL/FixJ family response regulator
MGAARSNSAAAGSDFLSAIARVLCGRAAEAILALFRFDAARNAYVFDSSAGIPAWVIRSLGDQLVFRHGEARGLVGLVAASGEPLYVPDCSADPRWLGRGPVRRCSAFLLPIKDTAQPSGVLCAISMRRDGFGPEAREVTALAFQIAETAASAIAALDARVERQEQGLRRITAELLNLGVWAQPPSALAPPALEGLRDLSPREWEVLRGIAAGQRVETIGRTLFLSPHTVRNHLKSIYRKLGVRKQGELREIVGRGLPRPGAGDRIAS